MALDWTEMEYALSTWFGEAASITVVWDHSNDPAPSLPYGTLLIKRVSAKPGEVIDRTTHLGATQGTEVEESASIPLELTVTARAYAEPTSGTGTGRELMTKALANLFIPSRAAALAAAGLKIAGIGDIEDETSLVSGTWQSRAAMDVRFRCVETAVETTGYIATVDLVDATT